MSAQRPSSILLQGICASQYHGVTASFALDEDEACLIFIKGTDRQGSLRVILSAKNISDILDLNGMFGPDGKVTYERELPQQELLRRKPSERDKDLNIERLIYDLLSKYILQMLEASLGRNFFPEVIPLEGHRSVYFRL
jgi:hypothetical protein